MNVSDRLLQPGSAPQVAHFHGLWQPAHARLSREYRARRIPIIISPHGMLEEWAWRHKWWKKWPYFYFVERHHLQRADCLLATARPEAERLRRFFPSGKRIETLPLGLTGEARPDFEKARLTLGWRADERVLLFLSRIHVKKGLDLLLQALIAIGETASHRTARLVIVGGGEVNTLRGLRRLAEENASRLPRIDWVGEVWGPEKWRYFQGADLFCLPTRSENFGLAVLEALQVGTPVLTTVATPWAELVRESAGWITQPTVDGVGAALVDFFAAERTGAAAREKIAQATWERFQWDALIPRYVALYRSVADSHPETAPRRSS